MRAYLRGRWPGANVVEYLHKASGAKFNREGLDAMTAKVRKGRADIVAVYKLDRLGRSLQHLAQLLGEFESHGTVLIATTQGIDTSESNPTGRLQMHILAVVAEFEKSVIVERINAGIGAVRRKWREAWTPRTLDKHRAAVAKLIRRGLSGRKIAGEVEYSGRICLRSHGRARRCCFTS